ncbi:MAG: flavin reductase family protein [Acidimicrobiia bacterium]|nr:flavin reductase family protein [Acidimicrobiia bacterium]
MIDRTIKKSLGQMIKGVQVVAARHDGVSRAYTSHWVCQISFDEPIVLASISPKHDTYPLLVRSGRFTVSILAADQISEGQYFSYPGRKFAYVATEYIDHDEEGRPFVPNSIAWLHCSVIDRLERFDHDLVLAEVTSVREGRLGEPPLLYSARHGWRVTGDSAREKGRSVRDELLARLDNEAGRS